MAESPTVEDFSSEEEEEEAVSLSELENEGKQLDKVKTASVSENVLSAINARLGKNWIYCSTIRKGLLETGSIESYIDAVKENFPDKLQANEYYVNIENCVPVMFDDPAASLGLRVMKDAVFEAVDLFSYFKVDLFSKKSSKQVHLGIMKSIRMLMGTFNWIQCWWQN
jgi:hypothetical protein